MSQRYNNEPVTVGKVLLKTTVGDIDIELWPKEAPLAVRNFCQLCMERYFDGVVVHRVVQGFMAQTGDPTGTGEGGESIYDGKPFKNEFSQRIRFNHPGQVAMATPNQSQFFISLGSCEWLNNKHTIFGKVTGNTIFNALKFNDVEVDSKDVPLGPAPRIIETQVLLCPFDDIVPRISRHEIEKERKAKEEKKKRKQLKKDKKHLETKNLRLISFQAEDDKTEEVIMPIKETPVIKKVTEAQKLKSEYLEIREKLKVSTNTKVALAELPIVPLVMSELEKRRKKYMKSKEEGDRQKSTLNLLETFTNKLHQAKSISKPEVAIVTTMTYPYQGGIGENLMEDEGWKDANDESWMSVSLKFRNHIDDQFRKQEIQDSDLTVLDSRTKSGKEEIEKLEQERKKQKR